MIFQKNAKTDAASYPKEDPDAGRFNRNGLIMTMGQKI